MEWGIGSVLHGEVSSYIIQRLLSYSDRSKSYLCQCDDGQLVRAKIYDGKNTMRREVRERYLKLSRLEGVIRRRDSGIIDGFPFDIFVQMSGNICRITEPLLTLRDSVVAPLNEGLHSLHSLGILVRDINPQHILWSEKEHECVLAGFSNLAVLKKGATATSRRSMGADPLYEPLEIISDGYSPASDYYSLGVSLYACLKRIDLIDVSEVRRKVWKEKGVLPDEIDDRIRKGEYSTFTLSDKFEYLIMGLTLPRESDRWGYGEVRAWCNDQQIPLIQKGRHTVYDMAMPIGICGQKCWSYVQLAQCLAINDNAINEEVDLLRIVEHIRRSDVHMSKQLKKEMKEGISVAGVLFRWIYILNPNTEGLWWKGKQYISCSDLAHSAFMESSTFSALSDILINKCISFWLGQSEESFDDEKINVITSLETAEIKDKQQGAYRFIQIFGEGYKFKYHGETYASLYELLHSCIEDHQNLDELSREIYYDDSFRAWVWAKGYNSILQLFDANETNRNLSNVDKFLLLCERMGNESEQRLVRKLYLNYSDFAPVTWLQKNLENYITSNSNTDLILHFSSGIVTGALSIGQMQEELPRQLRLYQEIVRATKDGKIKAKSARFAFSEQWNGIEVTPIFLEAIKVINIEERN